MKYRIQNENESELKGDAETAISSFSHFIASTEEEFIVHQFPTGVGGECAVQRYQKATRDKENDLFNVMIVDDHSQGWQVMTDPDAMERLVKTKNGNIHRRYLVPEELAVAAVVAFLKKAELPDIGEWRPVEEVPALHFA